MRNARPSHFPGRFAAAMHPSRRVFRPAAERFPDGSGRCRRRTALFLALLADRCEPYFDRERDRQTAAQDRNRELNRSAASAQPYVDIAADVGLSSHEEGHAMDAFDVPGKTAPRQARDEAVDSDVGEVSGDSQPSARRPLWRNQARRGELVVPPAPQSEGPFATVELESAPASAHVGSVLIEARGVTVRLDGDVSTARIKCRLAYLGIFRRQGLARTGIVLVCFRRPRRSIHPSRMLLSLGESLAGK